MVTVFLKAPGAQLHALGVLSHTPEPQQAIRVKDIYSSCAKTTNRQELSWEILGVLLYLLALGGDCSLHSHDRNQVLQRHL